MPAVDSLPGPSSESGPVCDAPVISNPRIGLRKQIEQEKSEKEDNGVEEMDTSQLQAASETQSDTISDRLGFHSEF